MAPNFFDLPRELRDQIYAFYFAAYASCPHGGRLQARLAQDEDSLVTTDRAWCPAVQEMRAVPKIPKKEMKFWTDYLGTCWGSHHPAALLLANKTTYNEAAEFYTQGLPFHLVVPERGVEYSLERFVRRWQHASPAKNVRNIILEWWQHGDRYEALAHFALALPAVERIELCLSRPSYGCPRYYTLTFEKLGQDLHAFKGLREIVITKPKQEVDHEDEERRFERSWFPAPVIINGVMLEDPAEVFSSSAVV
ncbi:hypothetical protein LTR10_003589 [Elasticomyces elasticus]|nr:hypothetical protein LTR10_003589 [Elasticomyces elasticus]KAK4978216.1 hypothetical protein LTR42_002594 [Elasticomyces elasticus]